MNTNSWIALGGLVFQLLVTVITVNTSASDIRSDVAVLKNQIFYLSRDYNDLKAEIKASNK